MNTIRKIWTIICTLVKAFIITPIIAWYKYLRYGAYIENTERNNQVIEFLKKVSHDPKYEPSTPLEHYIEQHLYEAYLDAINDHEEEIRNEYDGEIPSYEEVRGECATQIGLDLLSYRWIDEED